MATKTVTPATVTPIVDLAALREQKRQLDAAIKAARAALPKQSPLERVIERQARLSGKWVPIHLAQRVLARMKAGQPRAEAMAEVVAFFTEQVDAILDSESATLAEQPAPDAE